MSVLSDLVEELIVNEEITKDVLLIGELEKRGYTVIATTPAPDANHPQSGTGLRDRRRQTRRR